MQCAASLIWCLLVAQHLLCWCHAHVERPFSEDAPRSPRPPVLDKTRVFMHAWAQKAGAAGSEGALIDHVNDWFACMTADAVVKVGCMGCARRLLGLHDACKPGYACKRPRL